jgi:hypothetical protein
MSAAVDRFIDALRANPELAASAQSIADCIAGLDFEAALSPDAAGLYECLHYVIAHPRHSLGEKLEQCHRLINRQGRQSGTLRSLTGWE